MLRFFVFAETIGAIISLVVSTLILYTVEIENYKSEFFWSFLEFFTLWQGILAGAIVFTELGPKLGGGGLLAGFC